MQGDIKAIKKAMIIGSSLPLAIYIIWELITLGVVPLEGANGLIVGYQEGYSGPQLMAALLSNSWIPVIARGFSFFAIITSFLGVSLCLMDFLADGIGIKKTRLGRILLFLLTFAPPLIITFTCRRVFLTALEYAGAFGVTTLLVLLPALMVWSGRYRLNLSSDYRAPGGKLVLLLVMALAISIIAVHCGITFGLIC
jgi:tyrosine-specific transport protein